MNSTPADDILRELGTIVWEAIVLEDHVYQVAGHIVLDPDDLPVGACIGGMITKLGAIGSNPDLSEAITWFEDARSALADRNAVMHGLPVHAFVRTASGAAAPGGPRAIEYLGRKKGAVGRVIPLEGGELRSISARLANVNARWQTITKVVSQFREVPWGPVPGTRA